MHPVGPSLPLLVSKLGGSLLDWPGLPGALRAYLGRRARSRHVLVVGGGAVVDALRAFDRAHALGEARSHALAIRAMDLTARCLASLVPGLAVVEELDALAPAWDRGEVPVFSPRRFLDAEDRDAPDPLPHSWDVTSDSIAARLAVRLGAGSLALLKSAAAPPGLDREGAAALGLVDPYFPAASRPIPRVSLLNLRDPEAAEALLASGRVPPGPPPDAPPGSDP